MKSSDDAIVKRCLEGDIDAFGLLVDRYQNAVYGLCYHMVGNFADAQDLTQEAFVKAYMTLSRIEDPAKFASLEDVIAFFGMPFETVTRKPTDYRRNRVLYKDIKGKAGHCYIHYRDMGIRMFFRDYKLCAFYLVMPESSP